MLITSVKKKKIFSYRVCCKVSLPGLSPISVWNLIEDVKVSYVVRKKTVTCSGLYVGLDSMSSDSSLDPQLHVPYLASNPAVPAFFSEKSWDGWVRGYTVPC